MISWYVAMLLRRRDQIRAGIVSSRYISTEPEVTVDLENEDFNNLLIVEKKLKELIENGFLSKKEKVVLDCILDHKSYADIRRLTGYTRITSSKLFERVCDRIAYLLGDGFTNEGYLDIINDKYKLTREQLEKARNFMAGNKRFPTNNPKGIKI